MSQAQLAERLGIKVETYNNYERGYAAIGLYLLLRCAAILHVTFAELVSPAMTKAQTLKTGDRQTSEVV